MKKWNRRAAVCIICLLSQALTPNISQASSLINYKIDNYVNEKTLTEALTLFDNNSSSVKQINLDYDEKACEYEAAKKTVDDYQTLYVINVGSSDADTLDTIKEEYLSALLNRETLSFFYLNKSNLANADIKKQEYNIVSLYYQIMVLDKKIQYYNANADYLTANESIAKIKYKYGRCTELEVNAIAAEIEENEANLYETQEKRDELEQKLEDTFNITINFSVNLPISITSSEYTLSNITELLNKNEYSYEEAMAYKNAYYVCNTCEKATYNSLTYKKYDLCYQKYTLQADTVKKNITTYAKSMIGTYKKYAKKFLSAQVNLSLQEANYKNISKKYEKGKSAKINVLEANVKQAEAALNYYSVIYYKSMYEYILDNGIYDVIVE